MLSIHPTRRSFEGLSGRHDGEGGGQALGSDAAKSLRILNGRAVFSVMSVRLAKAMPYTSPEFWLKMQLSYDL